MFRVDPMLSGPLGSLYDAARAAFPEVRLSGAQFAAALGARGGWLRWCQIVLRRPPRVRLAARGARAA